MTIRVHQLAKELGLSSKELLDKLAALKIDVKGHMSSLEDATVEKLRGEFSAKAKPVKATKKAEEQKEPKHEVKPEPAAVVKPQPVTPVKPQPKAPAKPAAPQVHEKTAHKAEVKQDTVNIGTAQAEKHEEAPHIAPAPAAVVKPAPARPVIEVEYPVTIKQLSIKIGVKAGEIITYLMKKSVLATINQNLDEAVASDIAAHYGYEVKKAKTLEEEMIRDKDEEEAKSKHGLVPRPPVVTFMGHVDHGKTSLLDYIRNTKVASKEKGGITQHIGAYQVQLEKGAVTFLDTPGHEAFTAMRARGANATDIVVLVVAADDGIMPQTKEAIDHARAAGVPIVVAINKCDLPDISLDKIKRQLAEQNLMSEEWGGKTICVPVSAKTGQGVDQLLEMLLLEAELLELKANPTIKARGVVVEGKLSPGKGVIATLLVKNGTLRVGDTILSGLYYGKVRAMLDDRGQRITEAPPAMPVEILGLQGVPEAGDEFFIVKDEKKAKTLASLKQEEKRQKGLNKSPRVTLENLYDQIHAGGVKELKIILKADVQGSLEALQKSLEVLSNDEVKLTIIHSGSGIINESDVMLALVTNAIIIGFTVKTDPAADELAKKEEIDIKTYDIIYEAINDVKAAMEGLLEPIVKEMFQGRARVQQVFKVSKIGTVAGSIIIKGTIARSHQIRLLRGDVELYKGKIHSLKRFKDDVRDVGEGIECGIGLEKHNDIKAGDIIESFTVEKIARRLESRKQ